MRRSITVAVIAAQLLATWGAASVFAQVVVVPSVPAEVGGGVGVAGAGLSSVGSGFNPAGSDGLTSFNDPSFFVLQGLSVQIDRLGPKIVDPQRFVESVTASLRSPSTLANPGSPEAIVSRVIAASILHPDRVAQLGPTLKSIQPGLGSSVETRLTGAAQAIGNDPNLPRTTLEGLREAADQLSRSRGAAPSVGSLGGIEPIDELFLGRLRRGSAVDAKDPARLYAALPTAGVIDGAVSADRGPALSLRVPAGAARLQPYTGKPIATPADSPVAVLRTADLGAALAYLRGASARDAAFERAAAGLGLVRPELGVTPANTFLSAREPNLLKLLRVPEDLPGGRRLVTDGRSALSVLIVAAPSGGFAGETAAEAAILAALDAPAAFAPETESRDFLARPVPAPTASPLSAPVLDAPRPVPATDALALLVAWSIVGVMLPRVVALP